MGEKELRRLRQAGAIDTVEPDASTAHQELDSARRHLVSAMLIAGDDPAAAFAVGYDAIRKAISAHLRARGYRVAKGAGYHQRTGEYAMAALDHLGVVDHIEAFDDLRQLRNQSEYEALMVGPEELAEMLAHARALVEAIGIDLGI